ncbi:MAG: hypothetical protein DMD89_29920 [Candidatus Rokuibacteriota bacterium]|nr:MAG: hypothetical protein DMD89_29920 [Candidatus Rokubacteria bacterium]
MPEERAATPDEVRAALDALGEADLVRLEKFARYRIRGLGRKAEGRDHDDLLGEAIRDTLDPEKRRWNKDVSFVRHLVGAMRSISSHWREQFDENEPLLESELLQTTDEGEVLSPLDVVGSGAPGAERILAAKEELERIEKASRTTRSSPTSWAACAQKCWPAKSARSWACLSSNTRRR